MRDYKIILISFVLLIFMIGAVSAASNEETTIVGDLPIIVDPGDITIDPGDDQGDDPTPEAPEEPLVGTTKEIYVNDTGDDSNAGSATSPYASIKKAVSDVNSADNATIYLSEGTFYINESSIRQIDYGWGPIEAQINALDFGFDHKTYGGSLTIIGAGADKTFVDGLSTYYFADIGENANIILKDINFNNFKNSYGGTIACKGNLTVDNCIFNNSYASGNQGGVIWAQGSETGIYDPDTGSITYITQEPSITVLNSQFISSFVNSRNNQQQGGGAIYVTCSYLYLENNTFLNTRLSSRGGAGAAICSSQEPSRVYIINNKFINLTGTYDASIFLQYGGEVIGNEFINCSNPSEDYSIVFLNQKCVFEKNIFTNSSNSVGNVYAEYADVNSLVFKCDASVINVSNYEINNGVGIPVNVTDDMGNIIKTEEFVIRLVNDNNTYYPDTYLDLDTLILSFSEVPENGIYNLTAHYCRNDNYEFVKSTYLCLVNINPSNDPVDLYVSPTGSDANNGTEEYPFETIQHAIDVGFEKTFTVNVHLLDGTYSGPGNVEFNIANKGSLQIAGEKYGKAIIDANDSWFVSVSSITDATLENLTFVNGKSTSRNLISGGNLKNCIIANNTVDTQRYYVISQSKLSNITYTNNTGRVYLTDSMYDSYFENNEFINLNYGGIIAIPTNYNSVTIIENCKFINNTATRGGVISADNGFTSRNNYFANNKASQINKEQNSQTANYGVIFTGGNGVYTFENDTFENNYGYECGVIGWPHLNFADLANPVYNFTNCKFINNSAYEAGVIKTKVGIFTNCEFINNTADYGGAISLLPFVKNSDTLELNNVVFTNNVANKVGNDIYLAPKTSMYSGNDYIYAIDLTVNFNDLNTSTLVDNIVANVSASGDVQIGGGAVYFLLNGSKIGQAEINNGVAILNYGGFEDGIYNLSGYVEFQSDNTVVNDAVVNVKLEGILNNLTYWVSNSGSDENGNGSQVNPFKSISHAVNEASKSSRNIIINIVEGIYTGDLNTGLELTSMNNITLIGEGMGKTIIDGNGSVFGRIAEGKNIISLVNLTIQNMLPPNTELLGKTTNVIEQALNTLTAPIIIDENANLHLDGVEITNCHGGDAIIVNNGNLTVDNSIFSNNGLSSRGLIYGGNVVINNSVLTSNVAIYGILYRIPSLVVNNSVIKDNFNLAKFLLTGYSEGFAGAHSDLTTVIENTVISNDGNISSLDVIGYNETYPYYISPAFILAGNVVANNISMINNYSSPVSNSIRYYDGEVLAAFGYVYGSGGKTVSVTDSTFVNLDSLWAVNTYGTIKISLDNCLFYNLSQIGYSFTPGEGSQFNITNSSFINCDPVIDRNYRSDREDPNCNFNDNYWGSNDKPSVIFVNPGQAPSFEPETWITLYSEDEQTVIKNVTDGENSTAYLGNAPIRTDYADNKGALDYAVVFGPVGYLFTTDDETNVIFNASEPIYPFEAVDPMDYRTPTVIKITGYEGDKIIDCVLVDIVGNPIANATITSTFEALTPVNTTTDANGTFKVKGGKDGILNIFYPGDDTYFDCEFNLTFVNAGKTAKSFINIDDVDGTFTISGVLVDDEGAPIADAVVSCYVDGNNTINITTDATGAFAVQGASNCVVDIIFAGNDDYDPVNATVTLKNLAPAREATVIEGNNYTQNAIDYYAGERGGNFTVQLKDASGKVLANKTVLIGYNGKCLIRTTDENGFASVQINLLAENRLTFAVAFLGDENYNATMSVYLITINKKAVTVSAPAKTFKASAKTKSYTVTLSTVKGVDGKTYFGSGKKVTLSLNGKTYTAKTNAKGQATFKLTITKKGTFTATVNYAGDNTYKAAKATAKIKIS